MSEPGQDVIIIENDGVVEVIEVASDGVVEVIEVASDNVTVVVTEASPQGPMGPQGIQGIQGIQGEKGEDGGIHEYVHHQMIPSDTWMITHNLGRRPNVIVIASSGDVVCTDIEYIDENSFMVKSSGAFSGYAFYN